MNSISYHWNNNNNAALLSSAEESVIMIIKELVKQHKWNMKYISSNVLDIVEYILDIRLLIIDDTSNFFSSYMLRNVLDYMPLMLMPKIVFISDSKVSEYNILKNMSSIILIKKPIVPSTFHSAIKKILKDWSVGHFAKIRKACDEVLADNQASALKLIHEINTESSLFHITASVISTYYLKLSQIDKAEKVLLSALKHNPKDPVLLLKLSNLYMQYGCVHLAQKILNKMRNIYGNSLFFLVDLLESYILLDNLSEAINIVNKIVELGFERSYMYDVACRLLYSEGRISEIEPYLKNSKIKLRDITAAWEKDISLDYPSQIQVKAVS